MKDECYLATLEVFLAVEADKGLELLLDGVEELVDKDEVVGLPHVEVVIEGHVINELTATRVLLTTV